MTAVPAPQAPLVATGPALAGAELARYARHLSLPGIGVDGQRRLAGARVLVLGAGGLGSPSLLYLAAAGVGTLGIVDDDAVDATNLQRQVIHAMGDIGLPKVDSAARAIAALNPHVSVVRHEVRLTRENALDLCDRYDVILDGCDNFPTRYLVSDAAEILGKPVVWGSIFQFAGQVSVFWAAPGSVGGPGGAGGVGDPGTVGGPGGDDARRPGVTYRDVFPVPPPPGSVPDCATGGVFGAMCATIGSVMATETIKLITGVGQSLLGRIVVFDALAMSWNEVAVRADPTRPAVTELAEDYPAFCGLRGPRDLPGTESKGIPTGMEQPDDAPALSVIEAAKLIADDRAGGPAVELLDVREPWEADIVSVDGARLVPSGQFVGPDAAGVLATLPTDRPVLVMCKAGIRSATVVQVARAAGIDARNVTGGILAWVRDVEPDKPTY